MESHSISRPSPDKFYKRGSQGKYLSYCGWFSDSPTHVVEEGFDLPWRAELRAFLIDSHLLPDLLRHVNVAPFSCKAPALCDLLANVFVVRALQHRALLRLARTDDPFQLPPVIRRHRQRRAARPHAIQYSRFEPHCKVLQETLH